MTEKFVLYEVYPGEKTDLFAFMDRLLDKADNVIVFENELLRILWDNKFQTPEREVWRINLLVRSAEGDIRKTNRDGLIIAREEKKERTVVEFIDGYTWYKFPGCPEQGQPRDQIGNSFDRLVKMLIEDWQ